MTTRRQKAIDRAAKLQAQMESEHQLGNMEAAEAFAAAMQRLMLEHELNDHEIEQARVAGARVAEEPIVEHMVNLQAAGIELRHARSANLERLAAIVGRAHLCRILVRPKSNLIWFVGTRRHAEVAEYMLATLHRALQKIAKDAYERVYHAHDGDTSVTKGYIGAFKKGFLTQLAIRYDEERTRVVQEHDAAQAAAGEACTALMRLDGALQRVDRYIDEKFVGKRRTAGAVGGSRRSNALGLEHGRAAANRIALRANAGRGPEAPKQLTQ